MSLPNISGPYPNKVTALAGSAGPSNFELKPAAVSFSQILERIAERLGFDGKTDLHAELASLQKVALGKSSFSNKELLLYQVKAGQMHLQVELVSKVAESGLAALRKLQQAQ